MRSNTARSLDPNRYGFGGGMFVDASSQITSAQNHALVENSSFNAGLYVTGTATLRVSQLTVARTLSAGAGIFVGIIATVAITNAVIALNSTGIDTGNFGPASCSSAMSSTASGLPW